MKSHAKRFIGLRLVRTVAALLVVSVGLVTRAAETYTVHEWGTFTSVQGGDGKLLTWQPLESSLLPGFVYDWKHPGLGREGGTLAFGKGVMFALQRMETPVLYFYADQEQTVDVSVGFPLGTITEWFPQAEAVGTSITPLPATPGSGSTTTRSGARWGKVKILSPQASRNLASCLPSDASGSHYFAARETDANCIQTRSLAGLRTQQEKFIFYRGVGNFETPLQVTMEANNTLTVANNGREPLAHLFALRLQAGAGQFVDIDRLAAGETRSIVLAGEDRPLPLANLREKLGAQMAESLVREGLYRREATAMVQTWKDSWFEEDGVRVLYVLPRAWTDQTLPLTLSPAPHECVRVMVGRAEVVTPAFQQQLAAQLAQARGGDPTARNRVVTELKKLGRFAQPAVTLATAGASPEASQAAWTLFQEAVQPAKRL